MRWSALALLVGAMVACGGGSYDPFFVAHGTQDPGPHATAGQAPIADTCQSACEAALRCGIGPLQSCLEFCGQGAAQQACVLCVARASCDTAQCAGPCDASSGSALQSQDPSLKGGT